MKRTIIIRNTFARDAAETSYLPEVKEFRSSAWRRFSQEFELKSDADRALRSFLKEHPAIAESRVRKIERAKDAKSQPTLEVTYEDEQGRRWTKSFADEAAYQAWLKQVGTKIARIIARRTLTNKDALKKPTLVQRKGSGPGPLWKPDNTYWVLTNEWGKETTAWNKSELQEEYDYDLKLWEQRQRNKSKDVVGSKEDVAYGEGYHSQSNTNPYKDPAQAAAWEKGRTARKNAAKMRRGYYMGEVRGRRFEAPTQRDDSNGYVGFPHGQDTEGPSFDYKSERGYVGRVLNSNGSVLAESEPFISERSVKVWLNQKAEEFIRQGKRVTTKFGIVFYDPAYARA